MPNSKASFGRDLRLLKPAEFKQVFQKSRRSSDRNFTVLFLANGKSHARLGAAIAKKILKRAVDRNLVKRVVRESFRLRQQELAGFDFVVLCGRGVKLDDKQRLRESLDKHWSRALQTLSDARR
ncbi:MAG: ribonuclease P protein component [Sedimenticola sp.]|nr:ribonuclease P protein component [Sedimenticola sp.]MCW8974621.1 ribonuclease P protein component [Sedimenticola sp.]